MNRKHLTDQSGRICVPYNCISLLILSLLFISFGIVSFIPSHVNTNGKITFYGWTFHCVNVPHFLFLPVQRWVCQSILDLGNSQQRHNERENTDICTHNLISFPLAVSIQKWGCWTMSIFWEISTVVSIMAILIVSESSPFSESGPMFFVDF